MRAAKIQKKAAHVGFDWDEIGGAMDKVTEELNEVREAVASNDKAAIDDELGDLLFACVNVSRFAGTDPECALNASSDKFIRRFTACEKLAAERGVDMATAGIEALDSLWDEVKRAEKDA